MSVNSEKSYDRLLKLASIFALAVACFAQSEGQPHRIGWKDLTAAGRALALELGFRSNSFVSEVDAIEQSTRRRLSEGEMDHLVFYLLQSRSFTTQPPVEPAVSAIRFIRSGAKATPAEVATRIEDLAQALLRPRDDRQRYFSTIIPAGTAQTLLRREYARTMQFLYRKESECSQAQQPQQCIAELYQKRGHSSDTAPDASKAVAAALLWVARHSPAPIQKVLIIGPGADFAPRTGFTDAAAVRVYQPELVRKAVVASKLGSSRVLLDCVDINARVLESASSVCDSTAKLNIVTECPHTLFASRDNTVIDLSQVNLIWWRRFHFPQNLTTTFTPIECDLIDNDCRATLLGAAVTRFHGVWVNHPLATATAENKLVQLSTAQSVGFRVPRTLTSQDPAAIRTFCEELEFRAVVKPVKGTHKFHIFTRKVSPFHLSDNDALSACPAMFQELIPGNSHLRVHCFGKSIYPILIRSDKLDWRENLTDLPFEQAALDSHTESRIHALLHALDLKMGVIDIKLTGEGEPVWLEINPQGQFLFSQALSGFDLSSAFVNFLRDEIFTKENGCLKQKSRRSSSLRLA